jgi:superfamily I DNA/RNA helicase
MTTTNSTKTWSAQQLAIFDFFTNGVGNLVVRARAGTGKTTTIIEGVRRAPEAKILFAAFNKRIQLEAAGKIADPRVEVKTLHSLGFAFIRRAWGGTKPDNTGAVEFDRARRVMGAHAPDEMVTLVVKLVGHIKNEAPFATAEQAVALAYSWDLLPDDEWVEEGFTVEKIADFARRAVMQALQPEADGRISFDDMVFIPVAANLARPWFNMVVIDEAQDMNATQILLAQRACKRGGRIVVVGDDRQAIYGFRGADSGSIDRLKKELRATELGLTITYRCGKVIVAEAQTLVPDYQAAPAAPEGLIDSCGLEALYTGAKIGDFVLSRKNAPLMTICLGFLRRGVPARIEGRDLGRSLAAIVKKLNARSVPDFLGRVQTWLKKETSKAAKKLQNDALKQKIADLTDTAEVLAAIADGAASVKEIVDRCFNLFNDADNNPRPAVVCSSVHKAKGLEADRVFLLEESFSGRGFGDAQEEANIRYVAVTRARHHLTKVLS